MYDVHNYADTRTTDTPMYTENLLAQVPCGLPFGNKLCVWLLVHHPVSSAASWWRNYAIQSCVKSGRRRKELNGAGITAWPIGTCANPATRRSGLLIIALTMIPAALAMHMLGTVGVAEYVAESKDWWLEIFI